MKYIHAELRRDVIARAGNCCEYCLLNQADYFLTFHIDHIIADRHGGKSISDNLCLCCPRCNTNKGTDFASFDLQTGDITPLYHPRKHQWTDHFRLNGSVIEALTPIGRVTVRLLRLNKAAYVKDREGLILLERYPCRSEALETSLL
jgi:HNH endonuclease